MTPISPTADTRREINPANENATSLVCDTSHLPVLPCGWIVRGTRLATAR